MRYFSLSISGSFQLNKSIDYEVIAELIQLFGYILVTIRESLKILTKDYRIIVTYYVLLLLMNNRKLREVSSVWKYLSFESSTEKE